MAGTRAGGAKAAAANYARHGRDFYKIIGAKGGAAGNTGGFSSDVVGSDGLTGRQRARVAGIKGGKASRRGNNKPVGPSVPGYKKVLTVEEQARVDDLRAIFDIREEDI